MKHRYCAFVMLAACLITASAQSTRQPLEGVWQAIEVVHTGPEAATIKPGPNLSFFSAKHYSRVVVERERPRLANPGTATAEQLLEVWGPFVAEAGSYEVTDNLITFHPIAAKNPAAMAPGASIIASYKLKGDILTLTVQQEHTGPNAHPYTVKFQRIE